MFLYQPLRRGQGWQIQRLRSQFGQRLGDLHEAQAMINADVLQHRLRHAPGFCISRILHHQDTAARTDGLHAERAIVQMPRQDHADDTPAAVEGG